MNRLLQVVALSLVLGTVAQFSVKAAPAQPSGLIGPLTSDEAFQKYRLPASVYLDGTGGKFLIYRLEDGRRLMFKLMPNKMLAQGILLSPNWKPMRGGQEIKLGERGRPSAPPLRFVKPQAARPPSQMPPDRYHPGVKLLARSGQG